MLTQYHEQYPMCLLSEHAALVHCGIEMNSSDSGGHKVRVQGHSGI